MARGQRTGVLLDYVEAKTGQRWPPATLYQRIRNPLYYGRIEYGKTSMTRWGKRNKNPEEQVEYGEWEGLVSKELWDRANAALSRRAAKHKKRPRYDYLLTAGVGRCSVCHGHLVGMTSNRKPRYACTNRKSPLTSSSRQSEMNFGLFIAIFSASSFT